MTVGCAGERTADVVYTNGKIYTVNEPQPWAEAVAIKDGKFIAVGTAADVEAVKGERTKVVDLGGKFVMPGFTDAHLHPPLAYVEQEAGNLLMDARTAEEVRENLLAFAEANPGKQGIAMGRSKDPESHGSPEAQVS